VPDPVPVVEPPPEAEVPDPEFEPPPEDEVPEPVGFLGCAVGVGLPPEFVPPEPEPVPVVATGVETGVELALGVLVEPEPFPPV
jgi:hypothetical protein